MRFKNKRFHPIEGAPGYYVNRNGFIFSERSRSILRPEINNKFYLRVTLYIDGARNRRFIHRLVAAAFRPNPHKKEQVNHLDFNKANNAAKNLAWVTDRENKIHSRKNKSFGSDTVRPKKYNHEEAKRIAGTPF
jgi:hypothetical protein